MKYNADSVETYMTLIPKDRVETINKLRTLVKNSLPEGFEETIQYGMIAYVVPLSVYPEGYLGKKDTPLPFVSIASQKNTINVYHTGIYVNESLNEWFQKAYKETYGKKIDMSKSCMRFKKEEDIPFDLLETLLKKMSVEDVIAIYDSSGN